MEISQIKARKAYDILKNYSGRNPYILGIQDEYNKKAEKDKVLELTKIQAYYIIKNEKVEPKPINKMIEIDEYASILIQKQYGFNFRPNKIYVLYYLGESENAYHVVAKVQKGDQPRMYFIKKASVLTDFLFEPLPVDIDFTKYNERLMERRGYHLLPHQEVGIKFLLERNGAILADSMGVAKTLTAIVAALHTKYKRILVICPSSVKINWEREIHTFSDNTSVVEGRIWQQSRFTIINYDILQNFHTLESKVDKNDPPMYISRELVNSKFDLIIIDEAHNLRNKKSIRGEIVSELATKFGNPRVWLLTGTPVANRPLDFYNLLKLIRSDVADDYNHYMRRYCQGRQMTKKLANGKTKTIMIANGAENLDELSKRTKHLLLRRLKEEVVDMPEKQIIRLNQKLSAQTRMDYERVWDVYLEKRKEEKKKGQVQREMVELGQLRKFIAMEAIENTYELAMEAVNQGEKVVIFTTFNEEQDRLAELFGNIAVRHNGNMSISDKQYSVDAFQTNDKIKVFLGNIISAGVGITLTAGTVTIFNSFSWVPGDNAQAEDRTWRIGQKNTCRVYYMKYEDTISEKVLDVLDQKTDVITQIIGTDNEAKILEARIMDYILP